MQSVHRRSYLLRQDDGVRWPRSVPLSHRVPTALGPAGVRRSATGRAVPGQRRLSGGARVVERRCRVCGRPLCLRQRSHRRLISPHLSPSTFQRPLRGILLQNAIFLNISFQQTLLPAEPIGRHTKLLRQRVNCG